MEIEVFALCQKAEKVDGIITLYNLIDLIVVDQLPTTMKAGVVFLKVRWLPPDTGKRVFGFTILSPSGKEIAKKQHGTIDIPSQLSKHGKVSHLFVHVEDAPIKDLGEHTIQLDMDGKPIKQLPLLILPAGNKPQMN